MSRVPTNLSTGWAATGCKATGGKPLLLEPDNQELLQLFFDDHITPRWHARFPGLHRFDFLLSTHFYFPSNSDAHIVDVRRATSSTKTTADSVLPIGAVFNIHLIQAQPLHSITDPEYFRKEGQMLGVCGVYALALCMYIHMPGTG